MTVGFTRLIETIILPPGILLLMGAAGLLLLKRRPRTGYVLAWGTLLILYLLSIPAVALALIGSLENNWPALTDQQLIRPTAQAIVVLAGGRKPDAPEYGSDTVSHLSLSRVRYAAWLYQRTHLPIITSGGIVLSSGKVSEAALMAQVLRQEFQIPDIQTEELSQTTRENALHLKKLLESRNINRIYLVTHAFHMLRAVNSFADTGIKVIPAPTAFTSNPANVAGALLDYLPQAGALQTSYLALHEYVGMLWYSLLEIADEYYLNP